MEDMNNTQEPQYMVVTNHEEQYSIWLAGKPIPAGWRENGPTADKQTCLGHIAKVWIDMRPLSLRKQMESGA